MTSRDVLCGALQQRLEGTVIGPRDARYDHARELWNAAIDKRPRLIAQCVTTTDIAESVCFAHGHNLAVTVRGGGHSVAGLSLCDDGLVIDLRLMRKVIVDPATSTASVEGGCTWGDFDRAAAAHDLATTGGVVSTTGVAGLTLGGGIGWLVRRAGPACYNLTGATLVTANGSVIHVDQGNHPDLLWALRGGGGLGVAASLEFRVHRVGPTVSAGARLYPIGAASEVLAYMSHAATHPPPLELGLAASLQSVPDLPHLAAGPAGPAGPAGLAGRRVLALGGCWTGDPEQAGEVWRNLPDLGAPLVDTIGPTSYVAWQRFSDSHSPPGLHNYWKAGYLPALSASTIEAITTAGTTVPSARSHLDIHILGGHHDDLPPGGAAYDHRGAQAIYTLLAAWDHPDATARNVTHTRASFDAISETAGRHTYVNYLTADDEELVVDSYSEPTRRRLAAIRKSFDPDGLFTDPLTDRRVLPRLISDVGT